MPIQKQLLESRLLADISLRVVRYETPLFIIVSLLGIFLILFNTQLGAYWSDDTYYYIQPARELASGKGFNPSYIFGPVLPFVLGVLGFLKADPLESIRWINAILFGLNLYLLAWIIRKITGSSVFSLFGMAVILLSDVVIEIHGWAMSEALAITFMLAGILALLAFIESNRRVYAVLAALGVSLAVLTRFALLPLIPAVSLVLLIINTHKAFLLRLRDATLFGISTLIPTMLYFLRNLEVSGHPFRYEQYAFEAMSKSQLIWFIYNWFSLFIPGRFIRDRELVVGSLIVIIATLFLVAVYLIIRQNKTAHASNLFRPGVFLLANLIVFSWLMLYLARGLSELYIYNARYLVPIFMIFIALAMVIFSRIWPLIGQTFRNYMILFFALFLIYYSYRALDFSLQVSTHGLGYSNIGWHQSETIQYLREHPDLMDVVSTGEMGIYFWTDRKPTVLAAFPSTMALAEYMCGHEAPLFIMNQMPTEMYGFAYDEVVQNLLLSRKFNDSEMYVCPDNR
jgi:4-amino-4-deoxy-L-arabinose transferase-like glycosyltransferase